MNRPRSPVVTEGANRAPQRAFFKSMGLTDEDIHKPWVGVASTWNEATPCNLTLDRQAKAARAGVKAAGGTPREFVTIAVRDGIGMGHEGRGRRSGRASKRDAITSKGFPLVTMFGSHGQGRRETDSPQCGDDLLA